MTGGGKHANGNLPRQKQVGDSSQEQMSKRGVHEANCGMRTAPFFEGRESHHVASVLGHRRKSSRKLHGKTADSSHRARKRETPVKRFTSPQFLETVMERREISVHVATGKCGPRQNGEIGSDMAPYGQRELLRCSQAI